MKQIIQKMYKLSLAAYNDKHIIDNYENITNDSLKEIWINQKCNLPYSHCQFKIDSWRLKILYDEFGYKVNNIMNGLCRDLSVWSIFEYYWDKKRRLIYAFEKKRLRSYKEKEDSSISYTQQGKLIYYLFKPKKINNRIRGINIKVRYDIFKRDKYTCQYCGKKGQRAGGKAILHIDHIIPISFGGSNSKDNLQTLCRECNLKKSDMVI